jgi:predicted ferric reductase
MEINVELTKDEYQSFIRKYYLRRNWTKRIAILAIIALLLSVLMLLQMKYWGYYIFVYFVFFSVVLMALFFLLPYCVLYLQMLAKLKKINDEPLRWLFKLSETGAEIDGDQGNDFFFLAQFEYCNCK